MEAIKKFRGDYAFLSNFYTEPDGTCVEREYQASKTTDLDVKDHVLNVYDEDEKSPTHGQWLRHTTPIEAKKRGNGIRLRPDWESLKIPRMEVLVRQKFLDHPELEDRLLATGNAEIIEGNDHGDIFWGVCRKRGRNELGKILMKVREELRLRSK